MLSVLKKYIWFLIDEVSFLESFLARESTKKFLQTVMKIIESDRAAYCKQWRFCFLTYPKLSTINAFCFKKVRNIETFCCDLWDFNTVQIRDKRSWYQIWKFCKVKMHFNGLFQYLGALWFSYIVFAYLTTLLHIISKFVVYMVARFYIMSCRTMMTV